MTGKNDGDKFRVLIADDDPDTVAMLDLKFRQAGFDTVTALDGAEALERFSGAVGQGKGFDLCILDYAMPNIKGDVVSANIQQMCRAMRKKPPETVIFTGSADANLMLRLQTADIGIALIKPQGLQQLERIINRFGNN